jgi:hypothetical protein
MVAWAALRAAFVRHKTIYTIVLVVLVIGLGVWARFGFTLNFSSSNAGFVDFHVAPVFLPSGGGLVVIKWDNWWATPCYPSSKPDTPGWSTFDPTGITPVSLVPSGTARVTITHTTELTIKCVNVMNRTVTVTVPTCENNPSQECISTGVCTTIGNGSCGSGQACCVKAPPITATLSAHPTTAPQGGTVKLTWTSTNATRCTNAYGVFHTNDATNNTVGVDGSLPYTGTSTYFTLGCFDAAGHAVNSTVNITLTAPTPTPGGGGGGGGHPTPTPTHTTTPTPSPTPTPGNTTCSATAPTGLALSATNGTGVMVSWTPGTGGAYQMLRVGTNQADVNSGCPANTCVTKVDNFPANQNSYQLTGLTPGTTYFWRVVTFNSATCYKDATSSFVAPTTVSPTPTHVVTPPPSANLSCAPVTQTVRVGQAANLQASGGTGNDYVWSAGGQIINGPTASVAFTTPGSKAIIVVSGNRQASCTVQVVGYTTTAVKKVSNVKTGPGDAVLAALLVSGIVTLLYVSYTHTSAFRRREVKTITDQHDPMDFRS